MKMEDVESKSHLQNSQISYDFSLRLAENFEGFRASYEILDATDKDQSFSEMTAKDYDQKKSCLIKHLTLLSVIYKELADQHIHLIGEVKKQNLDFSESRYPQVIDELWFQHNVNEMLEVIEQDESFSEMTAENYDQKMSNLMEHVNELSSMYSVLAAQHYNMIREFKKQNLDSSDQSSPKVTEEPEFQQIVNDVLEEIEQDESFSEMTTENYEQKKSYLIKHLSKLSCMHKVLADQHVHLIGKVKKQNDDVSDVSSQVTEELVVFQQKVNEILEAIEQDKNFSEMTAENYDQKKSYLIQHLTELSRMHRVLVDQHVLLIGEVKKQNLDSSDPSSSRATQMSKTIIPRKPSFPLSPDSETFLSAVNLLQSGVDDDSRKNSDAEVEPVSYLKKLLEDERSTLHEIQDESQIKTQKSRLEAWLEKVIKHVEREISDSNLEVKTMGDELQTTIKKLSIAGNAILNLKKERDSNRNEIQRLNAQHTSDQKLLNSVRQEVFAHLEQVSKFQEQLAFLKGEMLKREDQIKELKQKNEKHISKISQLEDTHKSKEKTSSAEIARLKGEVKTKSTSFEDLRNKYKNLIAGRTKLDVVRDTLRAEKRSQDDRIKELETRLSSLQAEHSSLQAEHEKVLSLFNDTQEVKSEPTPRVEELETHLSSLQAEHSSLQAEHEKVLSWFNDAQEVKSELTLRVEELETRLSSLQAEHEKVLSWFNDTQEAKSELTLRVEELEREVDRLKEVISDRTEEKIEAIRQLSSSLDHYMSRYNELQEAFAAKRAWCFNF